MKRALLVVPVLLATVLVAASAPAGSPPAQPEVERGTYLAKIMGCHDCHTPAQMGPHGLQPDMSRAFSGHPEALTMPPAPDLGKGPWVWAGAGTMTAFAGPWGVSFAANLTPDKETGIGNWSEKTFIDAVRSGRHEGRGRPILPPMPYENLKAATDQDLKALFAYMRSLPPIKNRVPQPVEPVATND